MGVIGGRNALEVDVCLRTSAGLVLVFSTADLSEKGLCRDVGVSAISVTSEFRLRRLCRERKCSSSSSSSESVSMSAARRARACARPSSVEVRETSVKGRTTGTRASVAVTVFSLAAEPELELCGREGSGEAFFLVMLSARTGPKVAVDLIELWLEPEELCGIWMRMGWVCLASICGTGGASSFGVSAGLLEPLDLTLTTAALPRTMVCAGRGETMAFWR
jgi:hypothetical protein